MNDAAVYDLWEGLRALERKVYDLENRLNAMDARIRARLKEEAEARFVDLEWHRDAHKV